MQGVGSRDLSEWMRIVILYESIFDRRGLILVHIGRFRSSVLRNRVQFVEKAIHVTFKLG